MICALPVRSLVAGSCRSLSTTVVTCKDKVGFGGKKGQTNTKLKKSKADVVLVAAKSIASNHQISVRKGRLSPDKVEFLAFDPEIQREVIFKEDHKIKSIREEWKHWYTEPSELKLPQDFKQEAKK